MQATHRWYKPRRDIFTCLGARRDGILEYYWGEHIHLGYYTEAERAQGYKKKDFKQAKLDFVDEMLRWSGAAAPARILDVGCGIGGTSRHLAANFPNARVQGVAFPFLTDIMDCTNTFCPNGTLRGQPILSGCQTWTGLRGSMATMQGSRYRLLR